MPYKVEYKQGAFTQTYAANLPSKTAAQTVKNAVIKGMKAKDAARVKISKH
ncbi:hypothetical protein [Deinococcus indicus]|uniref:hypothetical protein n=1 Tax=Deinococcus indicus TaxID=223556 RepID=UPI00155171A2|nr:hypothetical protein [Deinococcus indicus]